MVLKKIRDFLNKETKISILKFLSLSSIIFSILLLVVSSNLKIPNNLNNIELMNESTDKLINFLEKSNNFKKLLLLYFILVFSFAIYKYYRFGFTTKVALLFISSTIGFVFKLVIIAIEKACINELIKFKNFFNGNIDKIDFDPSILSKISKYYFNFKLITPQKINEEKEDDKKDKKDKNKKQKNNNSSYRNVYHVLAEKYENNTESFKPMKFNDKNFNTIQKFLDNSLFMKYQKYLILIYALQILINIILVYIPLFVNDNIPLTGKDKEKDLCNLIKNVKEKYSTPNK